MKMIKQRRQEKLGEFLAPQVNSVKGDSIERDSWNPASEISRLTSEKQSQVENRRSCLSQELEIEP